MNDIAIIILLSFTIFILVVFVILLIIYNVHLKTTLINPSLCPVNTGDFTVVLNKDILVLNTCGTNKSGPCIFTNVVTLQDAVNKCNLYNCDAFIYDEKNMKMSIVSNNLENEGSYNVYLKEN